MAKTTPLHQAHLDAGAKMIEFAGYEMPVRYGSQVEEHHAVRQALGIFDVSHMGEFFITGKQAKELVNYLTTNDVSRLSAGRAQYSCLCYENGTIVDDLIVYCISEEQFMLVVNASNIEKDFAHIAAIGKNYDAVLEDRSEQYALLAVQGPKAMEVLQEHTDFNLKDIPFYNFAVAEFAGVNATIISNTGYTGSGGFELYLPSDQAERIWNLLLEKGATQGIKPCGLGARETLRLEMGFCLYGNDIDDTTTPLEAKLGWITKLRTDFVGKEALQKQKEAGVAKKLVAFTLPSKRTIPRKGFPLFNGAGEEIGHVTSGTYGPSVEQAIGMGYVKAEYAKKGEKVFVEIRRNKEEATLVIPPFYKAE